MSLSKLKDLLQTFAPDEGPEVVAGFYKDSTFSIISTVAYLIGVPLHIFENESLPPELGAFYKLNTDKNARIIRNLCMLRRIPAWSWNIRHLIRYQTPKACYWK